MKGPCMSSRQRRYELDSLDLLMLEKLLASGRTAFKEIAETAKSDQRTIAGRFDRMMKLGIIQRVTIEVDWSKIGLSATAYMGSTTTLGEEDRRKLFDFIHREPRILEAYTTIGSNEYFMKVIDLDIATLRSEICAPLEPLTVDLTTSLVVESIKVPDFGGLLRYRKKASL